MQIKTAETTSKKRFRLRLKQSNRCYPSFTCFIVLHTVTLHLENILSPAHYQRCSKFFTLHDFKKAALLQFEEGGIYTQFVRTGVTYQKHLVSLRILNERLKNTFHVHHTSLNTKPSHIDFWILLHTTLLCARTILSSYPQQILYLNNIWYK